ncbi:adaptin ear-binding coat-associated protein 1-like [Lytechinus pictus]|uniref:adaptin ear-binding coat-associated protein 1-like n=1 Tax=Lytechinus pictus TaxID=7653 RepID=UPI00240D8A4E|nr:adaptin ear-binding coat-associated protein 1-like [Lytechinus pictus]XP_054751268.1 adaptin ear-binding coat-associated protein 1-like [Lytechinus pictus]
MADIDYERVLCVKPEVHVFRIPPRTSNRGYRAADWKLESPDWTGRMKIVTKDKKLSIKLEDKAGELFAQAPIDTYPGPEVETVLDSSRYFVIRIQDDSGRKAFIGIGFHDRGDSFDFNVTLQDHFKGVKQEQQLQMEMADASKNPAPKLDLGFKEGQTIRINLGNKSAKSRPKPSAGGGGTPILLPPPPGAGSGAGIKAPPMAVPPPAQQQQQAVQPNPSQQPSDLLGGFGSSFSAPPPATVQPQTQQNTSASEWGDFTSAQTSSNDGGWVQF